MRQLAGIRAKYGRAHAAPLGGLISGTRGVVVRPALCARGGARKFTNRFPTTRSSIAMLLNGCIMKHAKTSAWIEISLMFEIASIATRVTGIVVVNLP